MALEFLLPFILVNISPTASDVVGGRLSQFNIRPASRLANVRSRIIYSCPNFDGSVDDADADDDDNGQDFARSRRNK